MWVVHWYGKGESDGETGVLKTKLDEAVRGQEILVNSAADFYCWSKSAMTEEDNWQKTREAKQEPCGN